MKEVSGSGSVPLTKGGPKKTYGSYGSGTLSKYFLDTIRSATPVWRIRDVYPGSDFFPSRIPDPGFELSPSQIPDPGSASKNLSVLTQKNGF
jgi:hypothetical protein